MLRDVVVVVVVVVVVARSYVRKPKCFHVHANIKAIPVSTVGLGLERVKQQKFDIINAYHV